MKYFAASIVCIIVVVLYSVMGREIFGWKQMGGAIPVLFLLALLSYIWKFTRNRNSENDLHSMEENKVSDKEHSTDFDQIQKNENSKVNTKKPYLKFKNKLIFKYLYIIGVVSIIIIAYFSLTPNTYSNNDAKDIANITIKSDLQRKVFSDAQAIRDNMKFYRDCIANIYLGKPKPLDIVAQDEVFKSIESECLDPIAKSNRRNAEISKKVHDEMMNEILKEKTW